jgi:hypothetical protein
MVIIYMCIQLAREAVGREIQQKKEELYDVIAKAEKSFSTRNFQNMRLLQQLSVQVNPRPWDSEWYDVKHRHFSSFLPLIHVCMAGADIISSRLTHLQAPASVFEEGERRYGDCGIHRVGRPGWVWVEAIQQVS